MTKNQFLLDGFAISTQPKQTATFEYPLFSPVVITDAAPLDEGNTSLFFSYTVPCKEFSSWIFVHLLIIIFRLQY